MVIDLFMALLQSKSYSLAPIVAKILFVFAFKNKKIVAESGTTEAMKNGVGAPKIN